MRGKKVNLETVLLLMYPEMEYVYSFEDQRKWKSLINNDIGDKILTNEYSCLIIQLEYGR